MYAQRKGIVSLLACSLNCPSVTRQPAVNPVGSSVAAGLPALLGPEALWALICVVTTQAMVSWAASRVTSLIKLSPVS
eukprot:CAMPEP_0181229328 /NCGR_PEP_ID=MMETSP1096-20121128/33834_1 /TAXON_ID=156174 ORGANISM="Chrysochromulina ericina, Strain CCMP281" /NCGR_SAMPLE_ID=MMETSP1096 /ASSEMBLY_ACC=CAM_ASM_000453 /LENGTH=77 /DNA_ID=CAMNT_0023322935 /DNA_START=191 /DNA_END=421 /DNA_ORIENTATION=-